MLQFLDSFSLRVSPSLVSTSRDFSFISSVEPRLPAVGAPVFLLQPLHVINHVKWQKAQHCRDCEGDLMELKMGCFVVMQSILFHRCLLAFIMAPNSEFFSCQVEKSESGVYFKQRSRV